MRSLSFGLAAAALAALVATSASAQDTRGVQPPKAKATAQQQSGDPEKDKAKGMAEAPPLLQQAGTVCTVSDALFKGSTKTDVGGKKVDTKVYEVACSDAPGYIVMSPEGATASAYNCLAMNQASAEGKSGVSCTLEANADPVKGMTPLLARAGMKCTPTQGRWAGANTEKKYDQYEVACQEGGAYIVQVPQSNSPHKFASVNCLQVARDNACQYLTKDQALQQLAAVAAPAARSACQINDMRFIGEVPGKSVYYEVGCADGKSGYVLQTDYVGKYVSAIDCARASTIGGGCQLTTVSVAAGEETGVYTGLMNKNGFPCTVSNYRPLGVSPDGREMVEVLCAGKSAPAVAFLPAGGAGQKAEFWDCARSEARGLKCGLVQGAAAYATTNEKITAAGKECRVNKVRPVGSTAEGGDFVEVGCEGGGALMVEYGAGNQTVKSVLNCGQAKSVGGGCKFLEIK
jgi:hypothetical protein